MRRLDARCGCYLAKFTNLVPKSVRAAPGTAVQRDGLKGPTVINAEAWMEKHGPAAHTTPTSKVRPGTRMDIAKTNFSIFKGKIAWLS
jgi:hypothetical protein